MKKTILSVTIMSGILVGVLALVALSTYGVITTPGATRQNIVETISIAVAFFGALTSISVLCMIKQVQYARLDAK